MGELHTRTGATRAGITSPPEPVRTIRLHESVIESILQRLDQSDGGASAPFNAAERHRFRSKAIIVGMQQPGDASMKSFLCPTRNVSRTGLACLHGGYVHVRTRCTIQLTTQTGALYPVPGTVVRCSFVERNIHEVGIQFETEVDPELFCGDEGRIRVLLWARDEHAAQLLVRRLEEGEAKVRRASHADEVINLVSGEDFDLLMLDVDGPGEEGLSAVKAIRGRGFAGTLVGLTAQTEEAAVRRILESGCHRSLTKEAGDSEIKSVLDGVKQQERDRSNLNNDDTMGGLIRAFVADLPKRQRDIQLAVRSDDSAGLRSAVGSLAEVAASYGFKALGEAAKRIEHALNCGVPVSENRTAVAELLSLCTCARA